MLQSIIQKQGRRVITHPLTLIVSVICAFFFSKWAMEGPWMHNDLAIITAPLEDLYAHIQRGGLSPLWAPELAGGYPLLANGQLGYAYLPHMILRQFFSGVWVINISLLLHSILAAGGMYLWLRGNQLSRLSAWMGSLLFTFGGALVGRYEMANVVFPLAWTPLLLFLLQRFLERGWYGWIFLWVIASSLHVLSGHLPSVLLVLPLEGILLLVCMIRSRTTCIRFPALFGAGILVIGLTIFHTLPVLSIIPETDRSSGLSTEELLEFSFVPSAFRALYHAHPFGHLETYRGPKNEAELAAYLGPLALICAVFGLMRKRNATACLWQFAVAAGVVGCIFALGSSSPVYRILLQYNIFRYFAVPARFFFYLYIALVILTAFGIQRIHRHPWTAPYVRRFLIMFIVGGTLIPVMWTAWHWYPNVPAQRLTTPPAADFLQKEPGLIRVFAKEHLSDIAPVSNFGFMVWNPVCAQCHYRQTFLSPFETVSGIALHLSVSSASREGNIHLTLRAKNGTVLRTVSLPTSALRTDEWTTFSFAPIERVRGTPLEFEITSTLSRAEAPRLFIHTNPGGQQYDPSGLLSTCDAKGVCTDVRAGGQSIDASFALVLEERRILAHDLLAFHRAAGFGLGTTQWAGALPLSSVASYMETLMRGGSDAIFNAHRTLTNRFPITHILGAYPPHRNAGHLPDMEEVYIAESAAQSIHVYRNRQAFPRAHFAEHILSVRGITEQAQAMLPLTPSDVGTVVAEVDRPLTFSPGAVVEHLDDQRSRVVLQTKAASDGFLVLRDVLIPEWTVTIDHMPAKIIRVDSIFRGVIVPSGHHEVVFTYSPSWLRTAFWGTMMSAVFLVAWGIVLVRQQLWIRGVPR